MTKKWVEIPDTLICSIISDFFYAAAVFISNHYIISVRFLSCLNKRMNAAVCRLITL